ncbi:DUF4760 domain-containing protein [Nocardia anaemiae]|uniref:DUF4760 domain-containing protein n=1 Tax=Nocardia anaemiae TaxID=263910 RepID=UPI0012F4EB26|nr:hypothetical protein [Nocardia anaemiae]
MAGLHVAVCGLIWAVPVFAHQAKESRLALDRGTQEIIAENIRQRQRATLDFIGTTIERQHALYTRINADPDFLTKASNPELEEFMALRSYLGYLENIAAGVNMSIFDQVVVDRTVGSRLVRATRSWGMASTGWVSAAGPMSSMTEVHRCAF